MYALRDYQVLGKQLVYAKIREGIRKVIYWVPTGCGKGLAMSDFTHDIISKNKKVITVIRRRELIFQTKLNYEKYHKHTVSVIMGQEKGYLHWSFCQVCSIDTIRKRMKQGGEWEGLKSFDVIIIDECHDTNSATYQEFFKWIDPEDKKIFIGFTASPYSMGGKPLLFWQDIVQPITPSQARDRGFLTPDITFVPKEQIDLRDLELSSTGEYKEDQLAARANDSTLIGDIVKNWKERGENRPTLLFCVRKDHSIKMTAAFNNAGVPAIHIDDQTTSEERKLAIKKLNSGEVKVLSSIGVLSTGVDIPQASCIILARALQSLVLYVQIVGRGLRPYKVCDECGLEFGGDSACIRCKSTRLKFEKRGCIVFDHGGNTIRHGLVFDDRHPKLAHSSYKARTKENEAPTIRITICQSCFAVYSPALPACPQCATVNKPKTVVREKNGELTLIDDETMRKLQLNKCLSTLHDLKVRESWYNWKPAAKWFQLHKQCGDMIFNFQKELELPVWLKNRVGIVETTKEII